jgi:hypothetical protein
MYASTLHADLMKSNQNEIAAAIASRCPGNFAPAKPASKRDRPRRRHFLWLRVARRV